MAHLAGLHDAEDPSVPAQKSYYKSHSVRLENLPRPRFSKEGNFFLALPNPPLTKVEKGDLRSTLPRHREVSKHSEPVLFSTLLMTSGENGGKRALLVIMCS